MDLSRYTSSRGAGGKMGHHSSASQQIIGSEREFAVKEARERQEGIDEVGGTFGSLSLQ